MTSNLIHRFGATGGGTPVNAYIIESPSGCVVVDSTLTVSDGRALRARVEQIGKPMLGVVITHTHPDHYGGLVELVRSDGVPVFATEGVKSGIQRDDAAKEEILRPMIGDEWARERAFPNQIVSDQQIVRLGEISLRVTDIGPGESPHDSIWSLESDRGRQVFSADIAYDRKHCYLADGFHQEWLANIERARRELPLGVTLHPGHGLPCGTEVLDWQEGYITTFLEAVRGADWSDAEAARGAVVSRMTDYLPTSELRFLMELSIDPVADQLGVRTRA
jgi:glyoxylase-like metal-dependent hydrolase (beta-lactamase superfamily II)